MEKGCLKKTLYVSDLDGTLLDRKDKISAFTAETINRLVEQGMRFTFATARSWSSAQKVAAGLRLELPAIVYNGAFVVDTATGERLLRAGFSGEQQAKVRALGEGVGLSPLVYAFVEGKERVSFEKGQVNEGMAHYLQSRQGDPRLRPVEEPGALYEGEAFYFTFIGERTELLPLWEQVREGDAWNVTFQQELYRREHWLELMPREATKWNAARRLKEQLGCERLVAFGDAMNDLPLFRAADESWAVENAAPEVKAAATGVILSNQEDGVARFLQENWRGE